MKSPLFLLCFAAAILTGAECDTGVCPLPDASGDAPQLICVPVGKAAIKMITPAPRLDTLNGKTIAIVGGSFRASITHPELKRLILRDYPQAKVLVLSEIGSAGVFPRPGVVRRQKDEFVRKLHDLDVDAVISGNGGCGLCTPKEMGSCLAAEYEKIPAVMIAAPGFVKQAKLVAQFAGVPAARVAEYPGAFAAHPREELLANTEKVLYPQIIAALTTPLSAQELAASRQELPPTLAIDGNDAEVNRVFAENQWTDGLPIIPPTQERVAQFLRYTDLDPDKIIAVLPPAQRQITPRLVAVNGVMAGCQPEMMPILIAFSRALADGNFRRPLSSTHAWTPFCWINGPLARQLDIDGGAGEISAQNNLRIGRFINLAMLNLGGYRIKENRMGTFGYLMPWCLAEDEEAILQMKWQPYHVQKGFALDDNVLTAASALAWGNNLAPAASDPQKVVELLAFDATQKQQFALGSGMPQVYRTLLLTAPVAKNLAECFRTPAELEAALVATARQPVAERVFANYWANPGSGFDPKKYPIIYHTRRISRQENAQLTPTPAWLQWTKLTEVETIPVMKAGRTAILVTGDPSRNKAMWLPGGAPVSIRIELPANWDQLMREAGRQSLDSCRLSPSR